MEVAQIEGNASRYLMIMQEFVDYQPLDELQYEGRLPLSRLTRSIDLAARMCQFIHSIRPNRIRDLNRLPRTADPFSKRVRTKISDVLKSDPELAVMLTRPGRVLGHECPPLQQVFEKLDAWSKKASRSTVKLTLVHGDCHIGNIMYRSRGKGQSIRLIDPNPTLGFSDAVYDYGKLFHFIGPVGWCKRDPACCRTTWRVSNNRWSL